RAPERRAADGSQGGRAAARRAAERRAADGSQGRRPPARREAEITPSGRAKAHEQHDDRRRTTDGEPLWSAVCRLPPVVWLPTSAPHRPSTRAVVSFALVPFALCQIRFAIRRDWVEEEIATGETPPSQCHQVVLLYRRAPGEGAVSQSAVGSIYPGEGGK